MAQVKRGWTNALPALIAVVGVVLIGWNVLRDPAPEPTAPDDEPYIDPDDEFVPTDEASPEYDYVPVERKLLDVHKEHFGEVRAEGAVGVRAPQGMRLPVIEIHVFEGDFVEEGDPLVTLDGERLEAAIREAEEAGSTDQAERFKSWREYIVIRAPNDGQVVDVYPELGHVPLDEGIPLVSMTNPESWTAVIPVPASATRKYVPIGTAVTVRVGDAEREVEGIVNRIEAPGAVAMTTAPPADSAILIIGLDPLEGLENGMFAKLELPAGEREVALVPRSAVESDGTRQYVRVWEGEELGLMQRDLKVAGKSGEHYVVEYGVAPGEYVAVPK